MLSQHDIFQKSIGSYLKLLLLLRKITGEVTAKDCSELKSVSATLLHNDGELNVKVMEIKYIIFTYLYQ